ncbi:uncharacterized protein A4U43_C01F15200 [Asparagus officinalis]|uniref:Uncharacterized protein n=1 Tax=Asparagus officinalis TaxID=4686 RepID=A0A5P1FPH3_ASPOF|nr:uncharacterized protein LOC109833864 [Asparagus officinalis]ONK80215.1 uncharacterized protein A4U43_C01F15200 [Asparagus officinalis]
MEEFEEAEIMWPDQIADDDFGWSRGADEDFSTEKSDDRHCPSTVKESLTVPINIIKRKASGRSDWKLKFDCYAGDSKTSVDGNTSGDFIGDIIPPHVLVSERSAGMMVGEGRALKGRRLSDVRNSILRMTGFLEA